MRVIAGDYKGRKLLAPNGKDTRPTSDKVKEAIFSMVQGELEDAVCLDLFAGSGALGIEALSRGAERVYFCDSSPASIAVLKQNLDYCRVDAKQAAVFACDWRGILTQIKTKCNLVFIDAPFEMCEYYAQILEMLDVRDVLADGALVVIERGAKGVYKAPGTYDRIRERRYGSICVDLLSYGGR